MKNILNFIGKSGTVYKFHVHPRSNSFKIKQGGIFLLTKFLHDNFHVPIYLGVTADLATQFINKYELENINEDTPTHICVCVEENESKREIAEKDLSEIAQRLPDFHVL
jgi:hypothetical protein